MLQMGSVLMEPIPMWRGRPWAFSLMQSPAHEIACVYIYIYIYIICVYIALYVCGYKMHVDVCMSSDKQKNHALRQAKNHALRQANNYALRQARKNHALRQATNIYIYIYI